MRISDWSSDVCSSDLLAYGPPLRTRDTLPTDVPAALATSRIVGRRVIQLAFSTITADRPSLDARPAMRSEERRVGKECVSTCRYRWSQSHSNKNNYIHFVYTNNQTNLSQNSNT